MPPPRLRFTVFNKAAARKKRRDNTETFCEHLYNRRGITHLHTDVSTHLSTPHSVFSLVAIVRVVAVLSPSFIPLRVFIRFALEIRVSVAHTRLLHNGALTSTTGSMSCLLQYFISIH